MDIREFTDEEIGEVNSYVVNQIQNSVDLSQYFILTEDPLNKTRVFISIYRILTGVRDFIEKQETKDKLDKFLEDTKESYSTLYSLLIAYDHLSKNGKDKKLKRIAAYYQNVEQNLVINKLINSFLVFAEKQELLETEKVTGLNLEKPEGQEVNKKLGLTL